ncbi:MAG: bifunctional allantoicase/OHCU decarboxylase, partial [Acidobacteria bacterium]|nr:bifunctional allantoicase/OHCU decarboxylase [Acidobacteriota bacterium]
GHRHNLIMPGRGIDMGDGWETRRRRGPGHDWAVVRLGARGRVRRVEVDTAHFKGNFPESCSLEGFDAGGEEFDNAAVASLPWRELLPRTRLQAHTRHFYEEELKESGVMTHLRFNIYPDGGISRLRIYGQLGG